MLASYTKHKGPNCNDQSLIMMFPGNTLLCCDKQSDVSAMSFLNTGHLSVYFYTPNIPAVTRGKKIPSYDRASWITSTAS